MSEQETTTSRKPAFSAYKVTENGKGDSFWSRIGAAWQNKDGGYSIQLDCVPLDGRIILTPPKPKNEQED